MEFLQEKDVNRFWKFSFGGMTFRKGAKYDAWINQLCHWPRVLNKVNELENGEPVLQPEHNRQPDAGQQPEAAQQSQSVQQPEAVQQTRTVQQPYPEHQIPDYAFQNSTRAIQQNFLRHRKQVLKRKSRGIYIRQQEIRMLVNDQNHCFDLATGYVGRK